MNTWESLLGVMSEEWLEATTFSAERLQAWERELANALAEVAELKRTGKWRSGPSDVLTIIGRHRDELTHSAMVEWLMTPTGHHGLGTRVLEAILEAGWPDSDPPSAIDHVILERETSYGDRRADIIVRFDDMTLVVENKIGATESNDQCEDVYQQWIEPARDVRFLLLTLSGSPPATTMTPDASDAWRSFSMPRWLPRIEEMLAADGVPVAGIEAVRQYIRAVRSLTDLSLPFVIRQGGGHVKSS